MPSLINTDNAGNVFLNYITPVIKGETSTQDFSYSSIFTTAFGAGYFLHASVWGGANDQMFFRLPAPGLETKTGTVTSNASTWRFNIRTFNEFHNISTGLAGSTTIAQMTDNAQSSYTAYNSTDNIVFAVLNQYAFVQCAFDSTRTTLRSFVYAGFCRETVYDSSTTYPLGACLLMRSSTSKYKRVSVVNGTASSALSAASDSITSPPIVCTSGTDPGDGSETATDIVIRDAAAPNNPVGKLWNCIDLPSSSVVGGLYKNTGNYDGDSSESEQDVYLCVMPWGTRKLGMRVWTENVV